MNNNFIEKSESLIIETVDGNIEIPKTCYYGSNGRNILTKDGILELQRVLDFRFEEPEIKEDLRNKTFSTVIVPLKSKDGEIIYGLGSANDSSLYGFAKDIPTEMAYKRAKANAAIEYLMSKCKDDVLFLQDEEKQLGNVSFSNNIKQPTENLVFNLKNNNSLTITPSDYYIRVQEGANIINKKGITKIQQSLGLYFGKPSLKESIIYGKVNGVDCVKHSVTAKVPLITSDGEVFGYGVASATPNNLDKNISSAYAPEMALKRAKANILIEYLKFESKETLPLYSEHDYFAEKDQTNQTNQFTNFNNNKKSNKDDINKDTSDFSKDITTKKEEPLKYSTKLSLLDQIKLDIEDKSENIVDTPEFGFSKNKESDNIESLPKQVPYHLDKKIDSFIIPNTTDKENSAENEKSNTSDIISFATTDKENSIENEPSNVDVGEIELRGISKYSNGITVKKLVEDDSMLIKNLALRFGKVKEEDLKDESSKKYYNYLKLVEQYLKQENSTIEEYLEKKGVSGKK